MTNEGAGMTGGGRNNKKEKSVIPLDKPAPYLIRGESRVNVISFNKWALSLFSLFSLFSDMVGLDFSQ
jgi:hypothetical protein